MAFCANCGRPLAEGEVCTCQPAAEEPKKNPKTKLKWIILMLIFLVIVAGCAAVIILMSNGYKKPLKDLTAVINRRETDIDDIVSAALPKFATDSYNKAIKILKTSDDFEDVYDNLDDALEEMYEEIDDEYGRGWKIKFDAGDKEKIDAEDLADIRSLYEDMYTDYFEDICDEIKDYDKYDYEDMADSLDISISKAKDLCKVAVSFMQEFKKVSVSDGYVLTGRFILTDSKGKTLEKSDRINLQIIKLNGSWTIDYLSAVSGDFSDLLWYLQYYMSDIIY